MNTPHSRQASPAAQDVAPHHTFSRGNCSAYGAAAKTNENWTTISDRAERRRVQNRIAQRAYRQKLKERLQLLEQRAAALSSAPMPSAHAFTDEACYTNMSSTGSSSSPSSLDDQHCLHCTHMSHSHSHHSHSQNPSHNSSRHASASPTSSNAYPILSSSHTSLSSMSSIAPPPQFHSSPHLQHLHHQQQQQQHSPELLPSYYGDLSLAPATAAAAGYPTTSALDLSNSYLTEAPQDMSDLNFQPYINSYGMPMLKFEGDEMGSPFM